ncbi:MAG: hypothetical protein E7355_05695 [Clostridiales bacterium]|nr:hypothetical protein [Clostridiales bacterium]
MASTKQKKAPKKYLHIKHCIKKMQERAKWVGVLYLIGIIALISSVYFQPIAIRGFALNIFHFWEPFSAFGSDGDLLGVLVDNAIPLTIATLYSIMLLVMLINLISALCHFGWLFKRKASKLYGFNRNMYAMDDIEKAFSSTFRAVVSIHFLIAVLAVEFRFNWLYGTIILGAGLFFHFLCGLLAGNTSLFTVDNEIIEEKREVGTFSVFVRNCLQIIATAGIMFFFLRSNGAITACIEKLLDGKGSELLAEPLSLVLPILSFLVLAYIMSMIRYALGTTEFEPSGREMRGRKSFLWLSLCTFIVMLGAAIFVAVYYKEPVNWDLMAIAGIAFVAFIIEICLRKFPKSKGKNPDEVDAMTYLENGVVEEQEPIAIQPQILPPVYIQVPPYSPNYRD